MKVLPPNSSDDHDDDHNVESQAGDLHRQSQSNVSALRLRSLDSALTLSDSDNSIGDINIGDIDIGNIDIGNIDIGSPTGGCTSSIVDRVRRFEDRRRRLEKQAIQREDSTAKISPSASPTSPMDGILHVPWGDDNGPTGDNAPKPVTQFDDADAKTKSRNVGLKMLDDNLSTPNSRADASASKAKRFVLENISDADEAPIPPQYLDGTVNRNDTKKNAKPSHLSSSSSGRNFGLENISDADEAPIPPHYIEGTTNRKDSRTKAKSMQQSLSRVPSPPRTSQLSSSSSSGRDNECNNERETSPPRTPQLSSSSSGRDNGGNNEGGTEADTVEVLEATLVQDPPIYDAAVYVEEQREQSVQPPSVSADQDQSWWKKYHRFVFVGLVFIIGAMAGVIGVLFAAQNRNGSDSSSEPSGSSPLSRDIGHVGIAGTSSEKDGVWNVMGSGSGIRDSNDQFHYVNSLESGNVAAQISITSFDFVNAKQQAGLMFRESLDGNSINFACMLVGTTSGVNGLMNQWRNCTGCPSDYVVDEVPQSESGWPVRLRIVKWENNFSCAYKNNDRDVGWTTLNSVILLDFPSDDFSVGITVTSHDNSHLATLEASGFNIYETGPEQVTLPVTHSPSEHPTANLVTGSPSTKPTLKPVTLPPTKTSPPAVYGPYTIITEGTDKWGYTKTKHETKVLQVPYGYMFVAEESEFLVRDCRGHKNEQTVRFEQWSNCVQCDDKIFASTVEVRYQAHSPNGWCNAGRTGNFTWEAVLPLVGRSDNCKDWNYPCPDFSDKKVIAC